MTAASDVDHRRASARDADEYGDLVETVKMAGETA